MKKAEYKHGLVTKPIYEVGRNITVKGRQFPTMTYMSNDLVPGSDVYVEFSWIWEVPEPIHSSVNIGTSMIRLSCILVLILTIQKILGGI